MTLAEIRVKKQVLEERLATLLGDEFETFSRQTGLIVRGLNVHVTVLQSFGHDDLAVVERCQIDAGSI